MEHPDLEEAARAFVVPLGYPPDAQWERIWVGNETDSHANGSLKHLCMKLAQAAFNVPRVGIDREGRALCLLDQLDKERGLWVAVRVEGTGWEIVRPRSQDAILAALETEPDLAAIAADDLTRCVHRAAIKWCGEKDRETFPEDITYFEHNWRWASGLKRYVSEAVQQHLQETGK